MEKIRVRCSALNRIYACPESAKKPTITVETQSTPAEKGHAVHEVMKEIIERDLYESLPLMKPYLEKYAHLDEAKEIMRLSWNGLYVWKKLRESFGTLKVEDKLVYEDDEIILTGSMDLGGSPEEGYLVILDHKTGRKKDGSHWHQLRGYLLQLAQWYGWKKFKRGRLIIGWYDTREWEVYKDENGVADITMDDLKAWLKMLKYGLANPYFSPSDDNCAFCPRRIEPCPARAAEVNLSIQEWSSKDISVINHPPVAILAREHPRYKIVKKACDNYYDILKALIKEHGPQEDGAGKVLSITAGEQEKPLNTRATWEYLRDYFGDDKIPELFVNCLTIVKKPLSDMVLAMKKEATGKASLEKFWEGLKAIGGMQIIQTSTFSSKKGSL